jgi:predicted nucleic acid-binding protein
MVIDTNIFIKHLRAGDKSKSILSRLTKREQIFTTSVTLYELLIGATNAEKMEDVYKLVSGIPVLALDEESSKIAADIYLKLKSQNQIIEFRDIFIAAMCIKNGQSIKTLNKKHFDRIEGLIVK